jgi:hypothetical protein
VRNPAVLEAGRGFPEVGTAPFNVGVMMADKWQQNVLECSISNRGD